MNSVASAEQVARTDRVSEPRMWTPVPLGKVLHRHNEIIHPGDRSDGTARFVGLEHIEPHTGRRVGEGRVDLATMTGRKPTFRTGHIVYGYLRPYLNKVWVAEFDGCSSVDQFAFQVNPDLAHTPFVAAFMRSEVFLRRAKGVTTPGQLPRISIDEIEAVDIALPPTLAEQRRIATWLARTLEAADTARQTAAERLAAADALAAAEVREVFDQHGWPIAELGDGLHGIEAGTSVVAEGRPARAHEWGVLKVSAVSWGEFLPYENKAVSAGYVPAVQERVKPGDFIISRANTIELAGAVVLVRDTPGNLMLSDKTLRLVLDRDVFAPEYLELAMRSRTARTFIEDNATGTSDSMRNISQPTIRAIPVPHPDLPTQRRIAADLSARLAAAEAVVTRCREELAAIDAVPTALLREAFGGPTHEGH